jgi:hypothetical protein
LLSSAAGKPADGEFPASWEKLKAGYATTTRVCSLSAGSQSSTSVATDFAQRAEE